MVFSMPSKSVRTGKMLWSIVVLVELMLLVSVTPAVVM